MRKLCFLLFFISGCATIFAQSIQTNYTKGEVLKDRYKYSNIVSIDQDTNGNVVIVRSYYGGMIMRLKGYVIEQFDSNLNLVNEQKYQVEDRSVLGVMVANNRLSILEVFYDEEAKGYVYAANTTDLDSISFTQRKLLTIPAKEEKNINLLKNFTSSFSDDYYTQLLFDDAKENFVIRVDNRQNKHKTHKLFWFDNKLNKRLEVNLEEEFDNKNFVVENFTKHPTENNIFVSGKAHFKRKKRDEGVLGRYQYELFKFGKDIKEKQQFDFSDYQITSLKTVFVANNLKAVGFYSGKTTRKYSGLVYYEVNDQNLSFKTQKKNPFSQQFMKDKYGVVRDKEIDNLIFRDLHVTANNDIIFNAEEYFYTKNYQINSSGSGMWVYRHHYNDIVCAKLTSDGTLDWARNINKTEMTKGDEAYVSYTSLTNNNNTCFFINSGEKPQQISNNRLMFKESYTRTPDLFLVQLNNAGNLSYKKVLEEDDASAPLMVSRALVNSIKNEVYFLARRGSKKQLFKVSL
jgi:hypothetical protein